MGLVAALVYGAVSYYEERDAITDDSDNFRKALKRWAPRIRKRHPTPRAGKRLINKLRFYAMMLRSLEGKNIQDGPTAVPGTLETAVVAFGVLQEEEDSRKQLRDGTLS